MNKERKMVEKARGSSATGTKRILFSVVTLSVPVVVLVLLELVLRVANYGPNLDLFVQEDSEGEASLVMNPDLKARYFSRTQFTPSTSLDFFLPQKPAGAYRIFCLGGSTTIGFPFGQVGSFSSFLRERLKATFPDRSIEVINLAMTATNSYTVNDIARELGSYSPDLLIVYDGHNEFYGALGSASLESVSGARWVTKLYLKLVHLKTFQLMRDAVAWAGGLFRSSEAQLPAGTTLMETLAREQTIPYGSDLYVQTLENYRRNLQELSEIGASLGAPIVVCTQVSNLRDLPPFVSESPRSPGIPQKPELVKSALERWQARDYAQALPMLTAALELDTLRADLQFAVARCLDSLGRKHDALIHYTYARDFDALRFRMSSDFNDALRHEAASTGLILADVETAFKASSQDSLIGSDLILEHLHPTLKGYALIARLLKTTLALNGLLADGPVWKAAPAVSEDSLFAAHPITALDLRAAQKRMDKLVSAWPFNGSVRPFIAPLPADGLAEIVDRYVAGEMSWEQAHVSAAEYFRRAGDLRAVQAEYRALAAQFPLKTSPLVRLAQVSIQMNQIAEARSTLNRALAIAPTSTAYLLYGMAELNSKRDSTAAPYFERALALAVDPEERRQAGYLLAFTWYRLGELQRAEVHLKALVESDPGFEPGKQLLKHIQQTLRNSR
jgi:tetratricopeptide (TPR) repeat protein